MTRRERAFMHLFTLQMAATARAGLVHSWSLELKEGIPGGL